MLEYMTVYMKGTLWAQLLVQFYAHASVTWQVF